MKKLLLVIVALPAFAVVLQTEQKIAKNDIRKVFPVPTEVDAILKKACNDCHSNVTVLPWYASIPGISNYINHHIEEGREELDFSEFAKYPLYKQFHKLEEIEEEVLEGNMPLTAYTIMHRQADLSEDERELLAQWTRAMRDTLQARYTPKQLARPKKKR